MKYIVETTTGVKIRMELIEPEGISIDGMFWHLRIPYVGAVDNVKVE